MPIWGKKKKSRGKGRRGGEPFGRQESGREVQQKGNNRKTRGEGKLTGKRRGGNGSTPIVTLYVISRKLSNGEQNRGS